MEDLAKQLAAPAPVAAGPTAADADCPAKLPDGTCADMPDTRQMVLKRGGVAAAAAALAAPIRSDIKMSFLVGSAQLTADARATLDRFARALASVGSYRPFVVEGHTDSSGTRASNVALSQARAQSVVSYLSAKGVDRMKLSARGYGFDRPLQGRGPSDPANRRVEVTAR
ncbi:OmpA family protein [Sandarakinorhabdus sp.]|uniref:OmpA family protein n=1 Tax=Sandarakinorhabdus sp. TaxID=1916663 RepID=UPI00286E536B|nr:OmpA family protein [Sandarakinorhabdus sp.]